MTQLKLMALAFLSLAGIYAVPIKNTCTLIKDYQVKIDGTSNLHSWTETVSTVSGEGVVNVNEDGSFDLETIYITMDVHSIKSDMGAIMNNNTYKALKGDANPKIIVSLAAPVKSIQSKASEKMILVKGHLTIAGVTRSVDMNIKIYLPGYGKLSIEGSQKISMADYGIKPPTALLGTLKTGNDIIISFKTNFTINKH